MRWKMEEVEGLTEKWNKEKLKKNKKIKKRYTELIIRGQNKVY